MLQTHSGKLENPTLSEWVHVTKATLQGDWVAAGHRVEEWPRVYVVGPGRSLACPESPGPHGRPAPVSPAPPSERSSPRWTDGAPDGQSSPWDLLRGSHANLWDTPWAGPRFFHREPHKPSLDKFFSTLGPLAEREDGGFILTQGVRGHTDTCRAAAASPHVPFAK